MNGNFISMKNNFVFLKRKNRFMQNGFYYPNASLIGNICSFLSPLGSLLSKKSELSKYECTFAYPI